MCSVLLAVLTRLGVLKQLHEENGPSAECCLPGMGTGEEEGGGEQGGGGEGWWCRVGVREGVGGGL